MLRSLAILFLLIIPALVKAQKKDLDAWGYPRVSSVINYLYGKVDTGALGPYHRYKLAKKAAGWYVYKYDYSTSIPFAYDFRLCWRKKSRKYILGKDNPGKYPTTAQLEAFK